MNSNDPGWEMQQQNEERRRQEEYQTDPQWLEQMKHLKNFNSRLWAWAQGDSKWPSK